MLPAVVTDLVAHQAFLPNAIHIGLVGIGDQLKRGVGTGEGQHAVMQRLLGQRIVGGVKLTGHHVHGHRGLWAEHGLPGTAKPPSFKGAQSKAGLLLALPWSPIWLLPLSCRKPRLASLQRPDARRDLKLGYVLPPLLAVFLYGTICSAQKEAGGRKRGVCHPAPLGCWQSIASLPREPGSLPQKVPNPLANPVLLQALTQSCSRISSSIFTASTLAAWVFLVKYLAWSAGRQ